MPRLTKILRVDHYISVCLSYLGHDLFLLQIPNLNVISYLPELPYENKSMLINPMFDAVYHDDVIKWMHFPRYWPFVRGIHRSPVNYPHKGQWHGLLMFDMRLNKQLTKKSRRQWFTTLSRPLWRHCNDLFVIWGWESDVSMMNCMLYSTTCAHDSRLVMLCCGYACGNFIPWSRSDQVLVKQPWK